MVVVGDDEGPEPAVGVVEQEAHGLGTQRPRHDGEHDVQCVERAAKGEAGRADALGPAKAVLVRYDTAPWRSAPMAAGGGSADCRLRRGGARGKGPGPARAP